MAAIGNNYLTLTDHAKRLDPDGKIALIAEIMSETNEVMDDAIYLEANLPTGHRHTVRDSLPSGTWRRFNEGVIPTKSTTHQVDDTVGMLEDYGEVDKDLADLNGNTNEFRLSEDSAHIEGLSQDFANTLFYGNTDTDPEQFKGLAPRYSTVSTETTNIGYNIVNGGGTGSDNTSIWLVTWGPRATFCIYPKGSQAGLQHTDKGQVTLGDNTNGYYEGYRSHYQWKTGLALKDWRFTVRIANIDISALNAAPSAGADIITNMISATYKMPTMNGGRSVWYCNKTIAEYLHHQARNKTNVNLSIDTVDGKPITMVNGMPVKRCDALLNTESTVSFS